MRDPVKDRARCRNYYARNAESLRAKRVARYYLHLDQERRSAADRMRGKIRPYRPRPRPSRAVRLAKLDRRWGAWAEELGVIL